MRNAWLFALMSFSLVALAGCSTNKAGALPNVVVPNIAAIGRLQLTVGTATIGEPGGGFEVGLNAVTTFRVPGGNPATLQNTPRFSGPAVLISNPGTADPHVLQGVTPTDLLALAQDQFATASPAVTQFGYTVGVFGYGLAGDNTVSPSLYQQIYGSGRACGDLGGPIVPTTGSPGYNTSRSQELVLPLLRAICGPSGTLAGPITTTDYYGGPPAWPSPQGYNQPGFFRGYPLGFTDFASAPAAGTYTLSVKFATASDYSSYGTKSTSAVLPAAAIGNPLPLFPQPTLRVQNDGSGLIDVTVPAGLSEAVINVLTADCAFVLNRPPNHYSILTRFSGRQTLFLSNRLGPPDLRGSPTHTFCTLSDVAAAQAVQPTATFPTSSFATITAVGFDYPAFEASYPQSTDIAPVIANPAGTADVTTADPLTITYNFGSGN